MPEALPIYRGAVDPWLEAVHLDTVARKSCPFEAGISEKARQFLVFV